MNKVVLMGRLTGDPELRYTTSNMANAKFRLAVDRDYKKDEVDFINCVAWGKTAETLSKYAAKGCRLLVSGSIRTGSYENREGKKVYTTDVNADQIKIIDFKDSGRTYKEEVKEEPTQEFIPIEEDGDLPF